MDDFSTASTETSSPDVSAPSGDVAAASNTGTLGTEATSPVSTPDATAQGATDNQIDVGWSLDDEAEPQAVIPDDDSDLEALQAEPGLDPERTPGLVTAVRQAREDNRRLAREVAALKQQTAAFEQYGGFEGVQEGLDLMAKLFNATPETGGTVPVLQALFDGAYPVYEQLVNDIARSNPDFVIAKLQKSGLLPANLNPQPSAALDAETLATIPEHLRDVAKSLPANVMDDLLLQPEEVRNWTLEREHKLQQMDAAQRQQAEQQWQQRTESAQKEGYESVVNLSNQYEQAHYAQLAKWSPFGADAHESNSRIYESVVEGAMATLLKDQKFAQMYADARNLLSSAPMRRLRNEGAFAQQDEQRARGMAAQFNTRLGQLIRERVKEMDSVFRDARAFREQQRQNTPQRTELPGADVQLGGNGKVQALDSKGKIRPEYMEHLASQVSGTR